MPYPRRLLVPPDTPGTYHVVSRCVRRAFLCGDDPLTGRCFDHRKRWLEQRILQLGALFAVAIHAYAVMSNHLHLVLEVDPLAPNDWSDEEVARRWLALSSRDTAPDVTLDARRHALLQQPERLTVLRSRLGSLSWFMRLLKEPLARQANREDGCSGRFWEGRFKTQALLDDTAVLASMVYVDLNPLRAGVADTPEEGPHTALRHRVERNAHPHSMLAPVASSICGHLPELSASDYFTLVDWTGRSLHPDKTGAIDAAAPPILERLHARPQAWLWQVPATESHYCRAIGSLEALTHHAKRLGLRWIRGIGAARALQRLPKPT